MVRVTRGLVGAWSGKRVYSVGIPKDGTFYLESPSLTQLVSGIRHSLDSQG